MDELNNVLEEIKQEVSKQTGVPSALLNGNSYQEISDCANALINFKNEYNAQHATQKKEPTTVEQFGDWLNRNHPTNRFLWADPAPEAPVSTDSEPAHAGHPVVRDGGEVQIPSKPPTTADAFEEWFNSIAGCTW